MDSNWATEQLQSIRTLMERSAIYRRALAPIMLWNGAVGIIAGIIGWKCQIDSTRGFIYFWSATALVALFGSFLLVRRQALKDAEPFWSAPTRRVVQALLPALFIGCFLNFVIAYLTGGNGGPDNTFPLIIWTWFYGCAIHAAGFFMPRGIKLFGWLFIITGCGLLMAILNQVIVKDLSPHLLMGVVFGGLHLAYGAYLYLTERGKNAA